VTVAICAVLGNLNKSVPLLAKFPSFKIDLKIARDVSELESGFRSTRLHPGSAALVHVRRHDDIQQFNVEVLGCVVLHGRSITDDRCQCGTFVG
jgi:hypothetical protein